MLELDRVAIAGSVSKLIISSGASRMLGISSSSSSTSAPSVNISGIENLLWSVEWEDLGRAR